MSDLSYLQAATIGLLQGITELFPVSSLGHSILVPAWVGGSWGHLVTEQSQQNSAQPYLAFIVATHVATAIALIVFYLRAWLRILKGLWTSLRRRAIETPTERLAWLIVVATIPVGILGLALEHQLRVLFAKPLAAAVFLTINGVILLAGEQFIRRRRTQAHAAGVVAARPRSADAGSVRVEQNQDLVVAKVGWRDAVAVGFAQSFALLAGISRSGITMVTGLARGLDHESAANFAFLLATPVILAAGVLKLPDLAKPAAAHMRGPTIVGAVLAGLASYVAVRFLTRYFENRSLRPFGVYCLIAGIVSVAHFA